MILQDILEYKKREVAKSKRTFSLDTLKNSLPKFPVRRDFKKTLQNSSPYGNEKSFRIIAEVKKASPSKGIIRTDFHPVEIAKTYEANGAAAISVLTDRRYFQGSLEHLRLIKQSTSIPILDKDFIIDAYQLYQAKYYGADAVLLIAAILPDELLLEYLRLAHQLDLDVLVEVHVLHELTRVLATGAEIIGINNRDLHTFRVDTNTSLQLIQYIPEDKIVVSESGIDSREVLRALQKAGVDAFLIGEALMRAPNEGERLKEFLT